jgi:hypothetical protein
VSANAVVGSDRTVSAAKVFASKKGERRKIMAGKIRSLMAIYHWSSGKRCGMGTSTRTCMEVLSGLMKFRLEDSERCTARASWMI